MVRDERSGRFSGASQSIDAATRSPLMLTTARAWRKAARRAKKSIHVKWVLFVSANDKLALGELRSTTSGLQTVLLEAESRNPLQHKGLRVHVFKIAVFVATMANFRGFAITLRQPRQRLI